MVYSINIPIVSIRYYIIGNQNKKTITITHFEKDKNDSIKQIEATSDYLYVLLAEVFIQLKYILYWLIEL